MEFTHDHHRIYSMDESGSLMAEINFPDLDERTVDINHTYVHRLLRGQGVADELIRAAIAEIQSRGQKIKPSCSYASRWFADHQEFSDLLY